MVQHGYTVQHGQNKGNTDLDMELPDKYIVAIRHVYVYIPLHYSRKSAAYTWGDYC